MKCHTHTIYALAVCFCAALAGCRGGGNAAPISYADTLYHPAYAEGFDIFGIGRSSVISVYDPWPGAEGVRTDLFLARGGEAPPAGFEGMAVEAPLKKVVCMSSSHAAYLVELGRTDAIMGLSGSKYVYNADLRQRVESGDIVDVGYDAGVNYELLAATEPDLVFLYGISSESSVAGKLKEMGIRAVHVGEFKELSALGKAEWLVAFGEMFDVRAAAAEMFGAAEGRYRALAEVAAGTARRPAVMFNAPYRDVWYVPGDGSYMVGLVDDAGGRHVAAGEDSRFTRPVSLEAAFMFAEKSDVWLNPNNAASIAEVVAVNPKFGHIPAVENGRVYNNTRRSTPYGGSDFWESGAVRPDVVLRDLINIFHPGLLHDDELFYFVKLD